MTNKIPKKALKEIHNNIKYIWEYDIPRDYEKAKHYIEKLNLGEHCHYYITTIWECFPDSKW